MRLTVEDGTLLLRDYREGEPVPPAFVWDDRVDMWRAQALFYRESLEFLRQNDADLNNTAPRYNKLTLELKSTPQPHPHQRDALDAWKQRDCRGVVVLPTGSGKSQVGRGSIKLGSLAAWRLFVQLSAPSVLKKPKPNGRWSAKARLSISKKPS